MDKSRGKFLNSSLSASNHFISRRLRFNLHIVPAKTVFSLPAEIILYILKHLAVKDVLSLQSSHPFFKELCELYPSVWKTISFRNVWPSSSNIRHFEKAAELGNIESLIKLGVAYLYNEGFSVQTLVDGQKIFSNGKMAAEMFCRAENELSCRPPFTWMFIRPPWAAGGACCKECVFSNMKIFAKQKKSPKVDICIAKTYELLDADRCSPSAVNHLQLAADSGSTLAQYMLWDSKYKAVSLTQDRSVELRCLRELREICCQGDVAAQLALCNLYVTGIYGGYSREQASGYVRKFVQSSDVIDVRNIYECSELTPSMRHILVDWLVEVAYMRHYDSLVLHLAVSIVDRFLRLYPITRVKLQLLGIAAIVLCSRYVGQDIMTIREGAYLTDHTYSYEEVVRMMGEIAACLKGHIRKLTSIDYVGLIGLAACNDRPTQLLSEYFCEMSLQYSDLSGYTLGCIASSCVLLARLTVGADPLWTDNLREFTGHSIKSLSLCALHIHKRCFLDIPITDRRDTPLQAVKLRYSDKSFLKVALTPMLTTSKLNSLLGVVVRSRASTRRGDTFEHDRDLIASPSRKTSKAVLNRSFNEVELDREKAATPTLEMTAPYYGQNESGYEGDEEDGNLSLLDSSLEMLGMPSECSEPGIVRIACSESVRNEPHCVKREFASLDVPLNKRDRPTAQSRSSLGNRAGSVGHLNSLSALVETPSDAVVQGSSRANRADHASQQSARLSQCKRRGVSLVGNKSKKSMFE